MSKKSDQPELYPSVAPSAPDEFEQRGPPPPSYEESLKMNGGAGSTSHQYMYSNPTAYQQQQAFLPPAAYPTPGPSSCGYANPYQRHIQQQQSFYNSINVTPQSTIPNGANNVLYLAKGAKVRTTATGAISIPPPPPGCAPTPGQLAAMSGQPVMIKKEKKSFF
ncbi:LOW QUALITY PROTEIN: uncharacterized protein LOC119610464 [Lucilia sericata]|uniref:LOW QUALITY PROTEIN: uncharacterized protein LOC119610464 n=1 Tax=Lucilia sericata TaxID=13632 RepID=UPI0018A7F23B|nr:LOW QUALITY PROTEIN: uncharacterized protein LOC119610464 [Lucilia sericata]